MEKSLTVGELRKALDGVKDDLPVYVMLDKPQPHPDGYQAYTDGFYESKGSGISNPHFCLRISRYFGW